MNANKAKEFASDVIYDIRSRGLLPVVILLAVGMLVVPMLIKGGGSDAAPPPPAPIAGTGEAALQNEPAVLTYNPSVRDYQERLSKLQEKDPFIQQFTEDPAAADAAAAETASVTTSDPTGGSTGSSGGGGGETGGSTVDDTQGDVTPDDGSIVYFYAETDILIGQAGAKMKRRNRIPELSFLPNEKSPVVVYMGATKNLKHAVFLVSDEVQVTSGQEHCTGDPADCDAVRLKDGDSVALLNAVDGKTTRLKVADVRLVRSTKPPNEK